MINSTPFCYGPYYQQVIDIERSLRSCSVGKSLYFKIKHEDMQEIPVGEIDQTDVAIYLRSGYHTLQFSDLYAITCSQRSELKSFGHEMWKAARGLMGRFVPLHKGDRLLFCRIGDTCYPIIEWEEIGNRLIFYCDSDFGTYRETESIAEKLVKEHANEQTW